MIQRLRRYVDLCGGRAAAAERRAAVANDERARCDFLDLAKGWRNLAQCFLFVESLERFVTDAQRAKSAQPPDPLAEDPQMPMECGSVEFSTPAGLNQRGNP